MKKRRYDDSSAHFEENEELELAIDEEREAAQEYCAELMRWRQSGRRGLLLSDETEDYY